jgi:hypothetical protein
MLTSGFNDSFLADGLPKRDVGERFGLAQSTSTSKKKKKVSL